MFRQLGSRFAVAMAGTALVMVASARADVPPGLYRLHSHPQGGIDPPPYGARFDELYDATSGHDNFTLDFDGPGSTVFMDVTASTIRIFGQSFGGRDVGDVYADDLYRGIYTFDFLYAVGVGLVPGDDDLWVDGPNNANTGFITGPGGLGTRNLVDERNMGFSLRVGDENDDLGHRGVPGISGWGWLSYVNPGGPPIHIAEIDWLFTAILVPSPGAAAAFAVCGLLAPGRRRRR